MTIMKIESHLNHKLKYDGYLFGFKNRKWIYTSSCPLSFAKPCYESWPYKIDSIMITNLKYVPENNYQCK
jgi:hypothetical protein